jgi:hypothetical protein
MANFNVEDNWSDVPEYRGKQLLWKELQGAPGGYIFQTNVESMLWKIRLNDFPDEPLYTLVVNGEDVVHFNEWPKEWGKEEN